MLAEIPVFFSFFIFLCSVATREGGRGCQQAGMLSGCELCREAIAGKNGGLRTKTPGAHTKKKTSRIIIFALKNNSSFTFVEIQLPVLFICRAGVGASYLVQRVTSVELRGWMDGWMDVS